MTSTNDYAGTPEMWAEEVQMMGECMPPVRAGWPDPYAGDLKADAERVTRERHDPRWRHQVAQEAAEHIVNELIPKQDRVFKAPGITVDYVDGRQPPRDVDAIKEQLLSGHMWISWMSDGVLRAMELLHGKPTGDVTFLVGDGDTAVTR